MLLLMKFWGNSTNFGKTKQTTMIYGLFVITLLVALLVFLLLNSKLIIESSSFKIPTPPPISKKKTYICKKSTK